MICTSCKEVQPSQVELRPEVQGGSLTLTETRVLIVEDEAIIARDIKMQLAASGFEVTGIASSAADAFRLIEANRPDVVLMDIRIKGTMDGVEAARIVRDRYALPVIYLTAHADDETLERAQVTDPFGYIVKPLGSTNVKAMIAMALQKHRMERELQNHRQMLATILQGMPAAVIVADPEGYILFLNPAAEQLTGWSATEAAGKTLAEIAPLEDVSGKVISMDLLQRALARQDVLPIPRDIALMNRSHSGIDVSGQLSVAAIGNQAAGVFLSLQDATARKREDERVAQEQQMFVAGELARGLAQSFYQLFERIERNVAQSSDDLDSLHEAAAAGKNLALRMMDFREGHGTARSIQVTEYLRASQPVLKSVCGSGIVLEFSSTLDAGCVLMTGNHFHQLMIHLALDANQRLDGKGNIFIGTSVRTKRVSPSRKRAYVVLIARSEKGTLTSKAAGATQLSKTAEGSGAHLALIRAIAIAAGGSTHVSEQLDGSTVVEVSVPRQESSVPAKAYLQTLTQRVILTIGLDFQLLDAIERGAGDDVTLLETSTIGEASMVADIYVGDIDLVVLRDGDALEKSIDSFCKQLNELRPKTKILRLSSSEGNGPDLMHPPDLAQHIKGLFHEKGLRAIASGT